VTPDPHVLAFTAGISLLAGILFGLSPALRATRLSLTPSLKESSGESLSSSAATKKFRLQLGGVLVVAQVALSLVLLVAAGLFVRTLVNLEKVNVGFDARNLLLFGIDPTQDGYKGQRLAEFYLELTRRLEVLPGVRAVSLSHSTLIGGGGNFQIIHLRGYAPKPGEQAGAAIDWVGPRFFETMGIPSLLGRTINANDTERSPKVVVVNEQFVRQFLPQGNPIGKRIGLGNTSDNDTEIVGVVQDSKFFDLRQAAPAAMYVPWEQNPEVNGAMNFEVRTAGNPMALASAVRQAAASMDSNLALYDVKTQVEQIDHSLSQERVFAQLTTFFGALAGLLAGVGLYGVMAFSVSRRTREIGIRMALGANRAGIVKMVLRDTFMLVGIGIAIGIATALAASRLISAFLYGVASSDAWEYAIAAALLNGAALVACWVPVRRAMRVDPMVALRYE
jgi:predicted permease